MERLFLALLWLIHWLPFPVIGGLGRALGIVLWLANRERRHTTLTNLRLCFPDLPAAGRRRLARQHFVVFAQSAVERVLLWWAPPARLRRLIRLEGGEHLQALRGQPVILLAPHFVGLDMGWSRLALEQDMVTMYSRLKNPLFDQVVRSGRSRFGEQTLFSRQDGLKSAISAIRRGHPFYYLPDLDYGAEDAIFVPFFATPAATLTALPRLARITAARVLLVVTRRGPRGYVTRIEAAWPDYPSGKQEADVRRMNQAIEQAITARGEAGIAEYFWSHKRFKTRPAGEKGVY